MCPSTFDTHIEYWGSIIATAERNSRKITENAKTSNKIKDVYLCICIHGIWRIGKAIACLLSVHSVVIQKYLHSILCSPFNVRCIPTTDCRCCSDENKWEFHSSISITMVAIFSIWPIVSKWNEIAESIMNELYYPAADFLYIFELEYFQKSNFELNELDNEQSFPPCFFICPRLKYVFGLYESLNSACTLNTHH